MAKMKGKGGKQFFVHHGEKLAFGVVALLVLYALGTANWVPYGGDPVAIKRAAEQAKVDYDAQVIKPEDEEDLGLTIKPEDRPSALVDRQLLADWSAGTYDLRVPLAVSFKDGKPLLKEVQDLFDKHPIRNLTADTGWANLNLGPEVPEPTTPPATPGNTAPPTLAAGNEPAMPRIPGGPNLADLDDQFKRRTGAANPDGTGAGGDMMYYAPELAYYDNTGLLEGGEGGGAGYAGTRLKGRGHFFVSVRGIVPLHELIRDVAQSRGIDFAQAAAYFQLIDFQLERQVANADGTWPADDAWEQVDRNTAVSILGEVDGFDLDPVPPQLTDVAVTMPLPPRITGVWGRHATHPDIESFSLSQADMENEMKYQVALLTKIQEQSAQQQGNQSVRRGPEIKGWIQQAHDPRRMAADLYGSQTSYSESYEDYYSNQTEGSLFGNFGGTQENDPKFQKLVKDLQGVVDKDQKDKALADYIKGRVTAVGNLLLFRYVDFAVEPGRAYRYRARLELENPNHGERVPDAAAPSVVEGETRLNAWSNITTPVTVAQDTYYFVHRLDTRRNVVDLDFYHYDTAIGTIVTNTEPEPGDEETGANIKRLSVGFGEPIGGTMDIWELNPGMFTFAKDDKDDDGDPKGYAFNTGDLLVTGMEDYDLVRNEHPDLSIPRERINDLQLVDALLVQKRDGSITQIDTVSQTPWRAYMALVVNRQNEPFRDLKKGPLPEGDLSEFDGLFGEDGGYMGEDSGGRQTKKRVRSVMRKSDSRADSRRTQSNP